MGRKVDLGDRAALVEAIVENVVDSAGVAKILRLSRASNVSTYRNRYDDFPTPILGDGGRCPMWLRSDVVAWDEQRRRRARPSTP